MQSSQSPVVLTYINTLPNWQLPESIASNMLVPGYVKNNFYNYVALTFWTTKGPVDIALLWSNPVKYFKTQSSFGATNSEIQKNLINRYHQAGKKVIVSAFGSSQKPTTSKTDPIETAINLSNFVLQNHLDGTDIDWEDGGALTNGSGADWLITFTRKLRELLPGKIISHAPQGPYFNENIYQKGGYTKIHKNVGNLINFYNIQFYNQQSTTYDTYETLLFKSNGWSAQTSVQQLISKWGIPANKIVIGKPASKQHAYNTGYVDPNDIGAWLKDYYQISGWKTGIMFWQFKFGDGPNDDGIQVAQKAIKPLLDTIFDGKIVKK